MPQSRIYELPPFLNENLSRSLYVRWLTHKAQAHIRRDRKRYETDATPAIYKKMIHEAVVRCGGRDEYTGEPLQWELISKYDNKKSRKGGAAYKREFANLPTVDHDSSDPNQLTFKICAWCTNSVKSDLTLPELLNLCEKILMHSKK